MGNPYFSNSDFMLGFMDKNKYKIIDIINVVILWERLILT